MKRIAIVLAVILFAAPLFAFGANSKAGIDSDFVPQPVLLKPTAENISLVGAKELEFSWSPHEGSRFDRQYYEFKLYKSYQTVEKTLILQKEVAPDVFSVRLDAGMFDDGQVYTWTLRQVYNSIRKSRISHAAFKVIKK